MQATRSSDSQVIAVLKQVEASRLAPELCRKHGISSTTLYKWPSKFGGIDTIADDPECGMPKIIYPSKIVLIALVTSAISTPIRDSYVQNSKLGCSKRCVYQAATLISRGQFGMGSAT